MAQEANKVSFFDQLTDVGMGDIGRLGSAFGSGVSMLGQSMSYRGVSASIEQQKEANQLALEDRIAARNAMLSNQLASMKAGQAARGVEGAKGIYEGAEKAAEADKRAMRINTANVLRDLEFQKRAKKYERDLAYANQIGGLIQGAASYGMAGGA